MALSRIEYKLQNFRRDRFKVRVRDATAAVKKKPENYTQIRLKWDLDCPPGILYTERSYIRAKTLCIRDIRVPTHNPRLDCCARWGQVDA